MTGGGGTGVTASGMATIVTGLSGSMALNATRRGGEEGYVVGTGAVMTMDFVCSHEPCA